MYFTMQNMFLLTGGTNAATNTNVFDAVVKPIVDLIDMAVTPAIALVASIGAIYCIILGAKLAKAEEPQDREKAKGSLKNAIIGFLLIFILLAALKISVPIMQNWYQNVDNTTTTTGTSGTSNTAQ